MKYYFTAFYKSFYDSVWLKAVRGFPGKAWSYFCLFVFVVALVALVPIAFQLRPLVNELSQNFSSSAPDFEANLKAGKLSVRKLAQPFVYRSSENGLVLFVDTVSTSSVALDQYVTSTYADSILVTSDRIEFRDVSTGESRIQSWKDFPDYSFSKSSIILAINRFVEPGNLAAAIVAIFIGLYVGFFVSKLYTILLVTLLVSVTAKLFGRAIKFVELFTIGLYAITMPSIISLVLALTGVEFSYVQFVALLAFMLAIVFTKDGTEKTDGRVV